MFFLEVIWGLAMFLLGIAAVCGSIALVAFIIIGFSVIANYRVYEDREKWEEDL